MAENSNLRDEITKYKIKLDNLQIKQNEYEKKC